ncbi:hypothetical protein FOA52_007387 [Chlamydomonas sp. UWO 241]|nr:hypothetical protein FOA52_007387 [Chlamydomonas sp. UWO 241]
MAAVRACLSAFLMLGCAGLVRTRGNHGHGRAHSLWSADDVKSVQDAKQLWNQVGTGDEPTMQELWADWCITYSKDASNSVGYANFRANMEVVKAINDDTTTPFWGGANEFADMSLDDFFRMFTGALSPDDERRRSRRSALETAPSNNGGRKARFGFQPEEDLQLEFNDETPEENFLWEETANDEESSTTTTTTRSLLGDLTAVKQQSSCGSCSFFVTAALIESELLIAGGADVSIDLSEQQMVSCVNTANSPYKGLGCGGGWLDSNINYVAWKGLNKESTWPYTNSNGACNRVTDPTSGNAVKLAAGATRVSPSGNEQALKNALQSGPVGLLFGAESSFLNYRGGIYQPTTCTTSINHAITLVGYGFDTGSNQWFWKIKNSWGTGWGEAGYARIAMIGDGSGVCGMNQWAYKASSLFENALLSRPCN